MFLFPIGQIPAFLLLKTRWIFVCQMSQSSGLVTSFEFRRFLVMSAAGAVEGIVLYSWLVIWNPLVCVLWRCWFGYIMAISGSFRVRYADCGVINDESGYCCSSELPGQDWMFYRTHVFRLRPKGLNVMLAKGSCLKFSSIKSIFLYINMFKFSGICSKNNFHYRSCVLYLLGLIYEIGNFGKW